MIVTAGSLPCDGAAVESDPWIPLKITWLPRQPGRPLYLRVSGNQGGELEIKVDPSTGALVQMVVIDEPPGVEESTTKCVDIPPDNRVPVIDMRSWLASPEDMSEMSSGGRPVTISAELGCWRLPGRMGIVFSNANGKGILKSDEVFVTFGDDGELIEISAYVRSPTQTSAGGA